MFSAMSIASGTDKKTFDEMVQWYQLETYGQGDAATMAKVGNLEVLIHAREDGRFYITNLATK